jgi:hypothetical protein
MSEQVRRPIPSMPKLSFVTLKVPAFVWYPSPHIESHFRFGIVVVVRGGSLLYTVFGQSGERVGFGHLVLLSQPLSPGQNASKRPH